MKKVVDKRPWGGFEQFTFNEISTVKILTVKPKSRFSLQYHKKREEFWRVLEGPVKITIGKMTIRAKEGEEVLIPKKTLHRAQALTKTAKILEISFGKFDENDIVRVEDDYGRV
ncbi:MAG: phosphomannose isomerase type II C-terminal cupin domain [archaeon]